jgi:hypothetical protein
MGSRRDRRHGKQQRQAREAEKTGTEAKEKEGTGGRKTGRRHGQQERQ